MSWLDRLKALPPKDYGLPTHRQNRQNPGSVSFDGAQVAQSFANEDGGGGESEQAEVAREAFEERPAIMEYDGGLSRDDAEQAAGMLLDGADEASETAPRGASELFPPRPIPDEWGDMRPCEWCRSLTRSGRCMSAWRGEMRAARDYSPTLPGQPRRCYFYDPRANDPDLATGMERWPELVAWHVRLLYGHKLQEK